jgi:plasmid stabilization system protein ParE
MIKESAVSPKATEDLDAIADYFYTRNVNAGENLFAQFVSIRLSPQVLETFE